MRGAVCSSPTVSSAWPIRPGRTSIANDRAPRREPDQLRTVLVGADIDATACRTCLPIVWVHVLVDRRQIERAGEPRHRSLIDARCSRRGTIVERTDIDEIRGIGPQIRDL